MKQIFRIGSIAILCICLLVGCGGRKESTGSINDTKDSNISQIQNQEMTAEELYQYFQQIFDAKGNALDNPEQLAMELAEVKAIAVDTSLLPEDYEAQYKEWRKGYVESLLKTLQDEYDKIVAEVPLYDGVNAGAAFAEIIDFQSDGIGELFILNLSWESPLYEWTCSMEVYGEDSGHVTQYGKMSLPLMYYRGGDLKSITFAQNDGHMYVHAHDEQGQNIFDYYYRVKEKTVTIADETSCVRMDDGWQYSSSQTEVAPEVYYTVGERYTEGMAIINTASMDSIMPIQNRGILPELPPDVQPRNAFLGVLETSAAQYACLADMNGDGDEDLVTVENITKQNEYTGGTYSVPIFRAYTWDGSALQVIDMNQAEASTIDGIYREKSTGKIYVCNSGGVGPFHWDYFERISECIKISMEDYNDPDDSYSDEYGGYYPIDWDAYSAAINRFELVENLSYDLPKYDSLEAVRQQLMG